jgi:hypothetical protein
MSSKKRRLIVDAEPAFFKTAAFAHDRYGGR